MLCESFCSSPWLHLRILPNGDFDLCRWSSFKTSKKNISNTSLMNFYNSDEMSNLRFILLNGQKPKICQSCYYQDNFDKFNGRKRQLLKSGITIDDFEIKTKCSPHYEYFEYSYKNNGKSNYFPVDLQIDLGNSCNSGCIMCSPRYSSKLVKDYEKLNSIDSDLFKKIENFNSWTNNDQIVEKFVNDIKQLTNIKYIHFLGGETLQMKAFYKICDILIENNLTDLIIGTTTNGTIYNEKIIKYIKSFKEFHLGISIESISSLNDYVRYPSNINEILNNIEKYQLLENPNLFLTLRVTPNIFTITEFDKLVQYSIEKKLPIESCDILTNPKSLRIELMPDNLRQEIIQKLKLIIDEFTLKKDNKNINIRNKFFIEKTISNGIIEYYDFLLSFQIPEDIEKNRYDLVKFIKGFESLRKNKITDYVPQYKQFLQHYGY